MNAASTKCLQVLDDENDDAPPCVHAPFSHTGTVKRPLQKHADMLRDEEAIFFATFHTTPGLGFGVDGLGFKVEVFP